MGQNNSKLDQILAAQEDLNAAQEDLKKEMRFGSGTYYASLSSIWEQDKCMFKGAAQKVRDYRAKESTVFAIYKEADGTKDTLFKTGHFPSNSMFPGKQKKVGNSSLAHFAPDDDVCVFTWGEVISLITGKESKNMLELEDLREFVCGNATGANNPFRLWDWNYLQLPIDHADYYDDMKDPDKAVIITPIWDPSKTWTPSTPYKLMVAAEPDGYKWLMGTTPLEEDAPQNQWLGEASPEEYDEATTFLQLTVTALADLLDGSELIRGIQELKKNEKEKLAADTDGKNKFSMNELVRQRLKCLYGEGFGDLFFNTYTAESASRKTSRSGKSGSQATDQKKTSVAEKAYAKNIITLLGSKEIMERLGGKGEPPKVYAPGKITRMPVKPILTIDLGEFFKGKEHMIPDPYWPGMKAAASIARLYRVPLLSTCTSLKDALANDEANDAQIPSEIRIQFDHDLSSGPDTISICSESEFFTGPPGAWMSGLQAGEPHGTPLSPVKRQDHDATNNIVTP